MAEVFDFSAFSKPPNMADLTSRLRKNVSYFRTNYAILAVGTTALVMLMNPWSLIVLALLAAVWGYMYIIKTTPLVLGGREFGEREKFLLLSGVSIFTIFFLTRSVAFLSYTPCMCSLASLCRCPSLPAPHLACGTAFNRDLSFLFNVRCLQRGSHDILCFGLEHDHDRGPCNLEGPRRHYALCG